jgi:hypothetical protein
MAFSGLHEAAVHTITNEAIKMRTLRVLRNMRQIPFGQSKSGVRCGQEKTSAKVDDE